MLPAVQLVLFLHRGNDELSCPIVFPRRSPDYLQELQQIVAPFFGVASSGLQLFRIARDGQHVAMTTPRHAAKLVNGDDIAVDTIAVRDSGVAVQPKTQIAQRALPSLRIVLGDLVFGTPKVRLGQGASCEVLRAHYLGTPVAVKRLHVRLLNDDDASRQFEREVALLTVSAHPNIVQCLGSVMEAGRRPCVVLELMEGGSLADARVIAMLAPGTRLALLSQVARALVYLHSHKPAAIVHRDVKPANILLNKELTVAKLTDFGISRTAQTLLAASPTVAVGTPDFAAPECFNLAGGPDSAEQFIKLDVYSFAITVWAVLANVGPFAECGGNPLQIMFAVASGRRPSMDVLPSAASAGLRAVLMRCWSARAADRPAMLEVLRAMDVAAATAAEQAADAADSERSCVVCLDAQRAFVLIPCGHLCVCDMCARSALSCPLCRIAVQSAHKVFQ